MAPARARRERRRARPLHGRREPLGARRGELSCRNDSASVRRLPRGGCAFAKARVPAAGALRVAPRVRIDHAAARAALSVSERARDPARVRRLIVETYYPEEMD